MEGEWKRKKGVNGEKGGEGKREGGELGWRVRDEGGGVNMEKQGNRIEERGV